MAFCIKTGDGSVAGAIRRVTAEQIDKALEAIEHDPQPAAVHDLRKRCKKIRGLVRFVRPRFRDYKTENAFFRDTARIVDSQRDAKVMQDTYDRLATHYAAQIDRTATASIRAAFTRQRQGLLDEADTADRLAQCRSRLVEARERSREWSLEAAGFRAFSGGLGKTYRRAREAASKAFDGGSAEDHHDLRKRVKYHWMHMRMLRPLWPDLIGARADAAKHLSDVLGDHHDLAVFITRLGDEAGGFGNPVDVEAMTALARERARALSDRAHHLSRRLLGEDEDALTSHLRALWKPWMKEAGFG